MADPDVQLETALLSTPSVRLTCRAPHRDPAKRGAPCGAPLGDYVGWFEFVTLAERLPEQPDGLSRSRCPSCKAWNVWRLLPPPAASTVVTTAVTTAPPEPPSVQDILRDLEPNQQAAALALAGGITGVQTAKSVGVSERTIKTWRTIPAFANAVRAIAPVISEQHHKVALQALFQIIEKDTKKGNAVNVRWLLSRTLFASFEQTKAAAGGSSVSVNVQQNQQQTQASIRGIWEERQRVEQVYTATVVSQD